MEEEKFSPVGGGSSSEEPKGFKVKVITILIVLLVIVLAIVAICTIRKNSEKNLNETLAIAQVTYELNRIKNGDELALEQYLNYSSLLDNSEDIEEDVIEDEEEVEEKDEEKDVAEEKSKTEVSKDEKSETNEEVTKDDDTEKEEEKNVVSEEDEDEDAEVEETDVTEDNDNIIKQLLSTFSFEVKDVQIEGDNSTVEVAITNKNSGEIFNKYFTRAIKLTINNTLSTKKTDDGKIAKELNEYLEEQMVSEEIPTVTNNVKFFLKKDDNNDWKVESVEKDLTNLVLPDFIETLNNLAETYGEYGD